jgi:hypothetical protein
MKTISILKNPESGINVVDLSWSSGGWGHPAQLVAVVGVSPTTLKSTALNQQ